MRHTHRLGHSSQALSVRYVPAIEITVPNDDLRLQATAMNTDHILQEVESELPLEISTSRKVHVNAHSIQRY
jgi:hypothetical protein